MNGFIIPTDELHHFSEGEVYRQPVMPVMAIKVISGKLT